MPDQIFYGHSKEGEEKANWQRLIDHLTNTANYARDFGMDSGLSEYAYAAALLHDIGKYSQAFQRRLQGCSKRVDHATAGAKEAIRLFPKPFGMILAYCISGHHGGLLDYGSPVDDVGKGTLCARLKCEVEDYSAHLSELDSHVRYLSDFPKLKIKPYTGLGFAFSFFTRMVYSTLVDADFLDTETFMQGGKKPRGGYEAISKLLEKFKRFLEQFENPQKPLDDYRTRILKNCIEKAQNEPGLFSLTVPTGGGKTFASLAFALNHAVTHNLKRIIYVIPFTSIIEQNAALFKQALGQQAVLEHHSNFDWYPKNRDPEEEDQNGLENLYTKLKLAAENWDIPIVVTTNVQFFESLFANRSSRCRKIHNIAKSVIIFDEAQMIPRDFIKPCLYAVAELVTNYGSSAVFCTATQPNLERFFPAKMSHPIELAERPQDLYEALKRVRVINLEKLPDEALVQRLNQHQQALCIVNTRKHARGLLAGIDPQNRYHLSTLMCAAHRRATLAKVRHHLKQGEPCRLVSTQLIEAGVDIDFPVGYRALAGLDSIIQAAGRINREKKLEQGELFVFEPDSSLVKRIPAYIQQGAEISRKILREYGDDPVSLNAIQEYYRQLYDLQDEKTAFDREDILGCFEKRGAKDAEFDFETAARKFHLIESATVAVVVPYDATARKLIEEVKTAINPKKYIRALQPYTVNIFEQEFEALLTAGLIDVYQELFNVLNCNENYDEETGLGIPEQAQGEAIFF